RAVASATTQLPGVPEGETWATQAEFAILAFLNLDHGLGRHQSLAKPLVLLTQPRQLPLLRRTGRATAPTRTQGVENPFLALPPPRRQMRRVQPFPTEQATDLTRRP